MADFAHDETEKVLKALEQKIAHMYDESAKELQEEIDRYFAQFVERDKKIKEQIGKIHNGKEFTEQDYLLWRQNQFGRGQRLEALKDKLAERATNANEVAISYVNDETPGVYSLNRNYTAYTIDKATGGGMSFHKNGSLNADFILFDEQTVKRLVKEAPDLMPYYPAAKAVKRGIDLEYSKSQITKSITSGIMQGKSIGKIANDLQQHITDMSRTSAVRAARTAMTGAQNAGRQDSYIQAEKMGIKVRKRWIATKDFRTRHSHGMLDGQTVPADEPFVSILGSRMMFPGDASGAVAADLYNCRCTMRTVEKEGIEAEPRQMRVRDPETGKNVLVSEMTYAEWAGWKAETQMSRRKVGEQGQEIIDKAAYNKLTKSFVKSGGIIIRGEDAKRHLEMVGAFASYITGAGVAFIRDDATISDVIEEMYHAEQDRKKMFGTQITKKVLLLREIDAQKYLIKVSKKYKIPIEEQEVTKANLKRYENQLEDLEKGGE